MKDRDKVLVKNAFSTVKRYEPPRVTRTREKYGEAAAKRQATAIALDDARKKGVKIPR